METPHASFGSFLISKFESHPLVERVSARKGYLLSFAILLLLSILQTGCVVNGRQVLLKEYGPSVPSVASRQLNGTAVFVDQFKCSTDLVSPDPTIKAEEPQPFKYVGQSRDDEKTWTKDLRAAQKQANKTDLKQIGNMRNGFGMVMSHVYALNDPASWLRESLRFDLQAQGAKLVESRDAADVVVSGNILLCRTDMYMTVDGTLLVDLDVRSKNGKAQQKRIHTHGATAAMLASEGEYFHALRDARQKFSIVATGEVIEAAKQK